MELAIKGGTPETFLYSRRTSHPCLTAYHRSAPETRAPGLRAQLVPERH